MTALAAPLSQCHPRRFFVFRVAAGVAGALVLAMALGGLLAPWLAAAGPGAAEYAAGGNRWHEAQRGALLGILFAGSLLALVWRPWSHGLLLRYLVLATLLLAALCAACKPRELAVFALPVALCAAVYPAPRRLLSFAQPQRPSAPLLALAIAMTAALLPDAWRSAQLQLSAAEGNWIVSTMLSAALALAAAMAATRRPGWHLLGILTGAALIYLGLAATVAPDQPGSWGSLGSGLATLGGWAFMGATWWEARRDDASQKSTA